MTASRTLAVAAATALLAGCGGGSPGSALPAQRAAQPAAKTAAVAFRIVLPTVSTVSARRSVKYISAATESAAIAVGPSGGTAGTPTVVNCSTVCSGTLSAPIGSDTFTVNLYDAQNAGGNLLSTGEVTQTIAIDQNNTISVTFNGVVASLSLDFSATALAVGSSATVTVAVNALDADGNTIVGPGDYVDASGNPLTVTLSDSDTSGATSLSQTSLTAPPPPAVTLSYNGAAIAAPKITASAGTLAPASGSLTMTQTFAYTGGAQSFTLPDGVSVLTVDAVGGEGGDAGDAGFGGSIEAQVPVSTGAPLTVVVGGGGQSAGATTYGGGAAGGESLSSSGSVVYGGSGGGASGLIDAGGNILILAGGGGGVDGLGVNAGGTGGGAGGVASGVPAAARRRIAIPVAVTGTVYSANPGATSAVGDGGGGTGGSATGAGLGGNGTGCANGATGELSSSGAVGAGGPGGGCSTDGYYGGGGGGGGYDGGGGGGGAYGAGGSSGGGGGGGGGSSYAITGAVVLSVGVSSVPGNGSVTLSW